MQLFDSLDLLPPNITGSVVTIGNFDGVHIGHRALLNELVRLGRDHKVPSILFTFDPHPLTVIRPEIRIPAIDCRETTIEKVDEIGVDILVIIPFTQAFAGIEASDFILNMISPVVQPRTIVVGRDHRFGSGRSGDINMLRALADSAGFELRVVEPVMLDGEKVSSTLIRHYLQNGDIRQGNRLLGAPFTISGFVTHGMGRGRTLGFPTANLQAPNRVLPPPGVYASVTELRRVRQPSVTYIGQSPTFGDTEMKIETHLLDFDQAMYESFIRVRFLDMIRFDMRFENQVDLITQIRQDVNKAREIGLSFISSAQ